MTVATVERVLQHAMHFEDLLADYFAHVAEKSQREGVRLLAGYMSRHRRQMARALENLPPEDAARLRRVLLQYEPKVADRLRLEGASLDAEASADQLVDAALAFNECLLEFYRQVLRQPAPREVVDLCEGLCQAEEGDEITLKKIKALQYF